MQIPSIKRTDPEQVFVVMKNDEASGTMVDGDVVQLNSAAAAADLGNSVVYSPATLAALAIAGVVSGRDILAGSFGRIQVYGVHNNVKGLAAINAAKVAIQNSATSRSATIGTLGTDDGAWIGFSLNAVASGRFKAFLRVM